MPMGDSIMLKDFVGEEQAGPITEAIKISSLGGKAGRLLSSYMDQLSKVHQEVKKLEPFQTSLADISFDYGEEGEEAYEAIIDIEREASKKYLSYKSGISADLVKADIQSYLEKLISNLKKIK